MNLQSNELKYKADNSLFNTYTRIFIGSFEHSFTRPIAHSYDQNMKK